MPNQFDTLQDAAYAALSAINKLEGSNSHEFIGLIYQDPKSGKFMFTDPQNAHSGSEARGKTKGTFKVPKGSVRAIIHNHPAGASSASERAYLSPDDINMSTALNVPSFIGVGDRLFSWSPRGKTRGRGRRLQGITEEIIEQQETEDLRRRVQFPIELMKQQHLQKLQELEFNNARRNPLAAANQQSKRGKL